jgi:hypothetical protein
MRRGRQCSPAVRARFALVASALVVQFAAVALIAPPTASAEVYTCGNAGTPNYEDGYVDERNIDYYEGAYAYIKTEYGAVCDTDTSNANFTAASVSIAGSDGSGFAESGFVRWYGSSITYFAQQWDGGNDLQTRYANQPGIGSVHGYYEKWQTTTGDIKSIVDATTFLTSSWDPFSDWDLPFEPQFLGSAYYLESDIAGDSSAPTAYTNLHGQDYITNAWDSYPCSVLTKVNNGSAERSDGEEWYDSISTCPSFNVYTDNAP